ncbi:uncharacterized protein LOC115147707 [Salmo trutta]|uniref:uncharacterized protein LOC115147707 n=1 Tax=Salmo trutta TaxID=8032 RepID=UPI001131293A|nr:uncharacterized protein LOC115147707 [Salmo trutta]
MTRFKLQPREGGANEHCSVPLCSVSSRYNGIVSFHRFPDDVELRKRWLVAVRRDNYCHQTHKVFAWNRHIQKRPGVWERRLKPPSPTEEDEGQGALHMDCAVSDPVQTHDYCAVPEPAALDMSLMSNHEQPSMSVPKSIESQGSGCGVPAQRTSKQGPEMVSVKLEDSSQPLELNVIVKEEERGIEKRAIKEEEVEERAVKEEHEEMAVKEEVEKRGVKGEKKENREVSAPD